MADDLAIGKVYRRMRRRFRELVKRSEWAEVVEEGAESSDAHDGWFECDAQIGRMLNRLGLVRWRQPKRRASAVYQLVQRIARLSGDRQEAVRRVIRHFCNAGGADESALCGDRPACDQCPLTEHCRYYARRPSLKEMPLGERPRERMIQDGDEVLTDAELLGLIIQQGRPNETSVELARRLLTRFGPLRSLANRSVAELRTVKGIGPAKAVQIKAAFALARRYAAEGIVQPGQRMASSRDIFEHYDSHFRGKKSEMFKVVLLDSKNRVMKEVAVSQGSLTAAIVHPREVFKPAIEESAAAVVFVHNHPSGDPTPSQEDLELTRRLLKVSELVGIKVIDHVIIGDGAFASLADLSLLKPTAAGTSTKGVAPGTGDTR